MISPIVTELPRRLESISRDTFIDGARRPAPNRPRPLPAHGVVVALRPGVTSMARGARLAA